MPLQNASSDTAPTPSPTGRRRRRIISSLSKAFCLPFGVRPSPVPAPPSAPSPSVSDLTGLGTLPSAPQPGCPSPTPSRAVSLYPGPSQPAGPSLPPSLSPLPDDVLHLVLSHLSQHDVASVARLNTAYHAIALPHLYHGTVTLGRTPIRHTCALLHSRPDLAFGITTLRLLARPSFSANTLPHLPNLRVLDVVIFSDGERLPFALPIVRRSPLCRCHLQLYVLRSTVQVAASQTPRKLIIRTSGMLAPVILFFRQEMFPPMFLDAVERLVVVTSLANGRACSGAELYLNEPCIHEARTCNESPMELVQLVTSAHTMTCLRGYTDALRTLLGCMPGDPSVFRTTLVVNLLPEILYDTEFSLTLNPLCGFWRRPGWPGDTSYMVAAGNIVPLSICRGTPTARASTTIWEQSIPRHSAL